MCLPFTWRPKSGINTPMPAAILPFTPRMKPAQAAAPVPVLVSLPAADHAAIARYAAMGGITVGDALLDLAANLAAHIRQPERR